jgi:hypothetical protein
MIQTARKPQTEISATAIYKVTSKATLEQCWFVPSDSQGLYYKVCFDGNLWSCTCKHGEYAAEHHIDCRCKHHRAVQISILANKAEADRRHEQENQMAELAQEMADTSQSVRRLSREEYLVEFGIYTE